MTQVVLMDGGMGQELLKRSGDEPTPLWSAEILRKRPELVRQVHVDSIRAGARVIIINAYSATRFRLARFDAENQFEDLQRLAAELALRARDEVGEEVAIAACLPPLSWSFAQEIAAPEDEVAESYREIAQLQAPYADVILCETMSSAAEGRAATAGAAAGAPGKPIWVAWSVDDAAPGRLRSGETLAEANAALGEVSVAARLLNCSTPEAISASLAEVAAFGGAYGAYPNGFVSVTKLTAGATVDALEAREDLSPEAFAEIGAGWVASGARVLGGCCEISPAHISTLATRLDADGYSVVSALSAN